MSLELKMINENLWQLPQVGEMRVPARVYAKSNLIDLVKHDKSLQQLKNVATLPGIQNFALAMPDIHQGYGFPIGGVAAMDVNEGVISPGGVGYDINCGVRFIKTNLSRQDVEKNLDDLLTALYQTIPTGIGSQNAIGKLSETELKKVLVNGAEWAINKGFGKERDLAVIEENGRMNSAKVDKISSRALQRGASQLGTLGSGNHFVEIGFVDEIFSADISQKLNLKKDQLIIIIHTGSRGFGHQVCDDHLRKMLVQKIDFPLPDKQLIAVKIQSKSGEDYFAAMSSAANFAWANRQVIMSLVEQTFQKSLRISSEKLGFRLIYDVSHNIAKFEDHLIDGKRKELCVHRKGATRAFSAENFSGGTFHEIGQPVIIPGDMGTESYLCVGTKKAMSETFGSTCHGAGRMMSRRKALKSTDFDSVMNELRKKNIKVMAARKKTLIEEMSRAYKNVRDVVDTMHKSGISKKVVRTKPLAVLKG